MVIGFIIGAHYLPQPWRGIVDLGVVVGGRLGYVLFYGLDSFIANPLFLFKTTEGGMSFHGGLLDRVDSLLLTAPLLYLLLFTEVLR